MRRDGLLGDSPDGAECARAYDKVPSLFEWHRSYEDMMKLGLWNRDAFWTALSTGRPSYQGTYWALDANVMYEQEGALMRKAANRLGYHLVLVEASFPETRENGRVDTIAMTWRNDGLTPIYLEAQLKLALLDDSDRVLQTTTLDGVDPFEWKPYDASRRSYTEKPTFKFSESTSGRRLALGLFSSTALTAPDIKLGIEGRLPSGWYPLEP